MKKNIYKIPYISILAFKKEDVICNSADTDFPLGGPDNDASFGVPDTDVPAI